VIATATTDPFDMASSVDKIINAVFQLLRFYESEPCAWQVTKSGARPFSMICADIDYVGRNEFKSAQKREKVI
jgi:hypothetical protein